MAEVVLILATSIGALTVIGAASVTGLIGKVMGR